MIAANLDLAEAGTRTWDVIVIGAGPAGALAARELARRGADVLLVDKAGFPRPKVCGCCLNLQALSTLAHVGLSEEVDRCGPVPLTRLHLAVSGTQAVVSLAGKSLSRKVFDAVLVEAAIAAGSAFLPETHARLAAVVDSARTVALKHHTQEIQVRGRVVLGAAGLGGRLLADEPEPRLIVHEDSRLGAGVVADEASAFFAPGAIYMACGTGGYVGLVRIEDGQLNIAAAFDAALVKRAGGLGGAAATVLREAGFPAVDHLETLAWHGTPLLTRHVSPPAADRVFLLGDAAGYVEPFSGEGMAWALAAGAAVVPFALRARCAWHPSLIRQWSSCHRHTIVQRQWICKVAANVLRRPNLVHWLVAAMTRCPILAAPVIRVINHGRLW